MLSNEEKKNHNFNYVGVATVKRKEPKEGKMKGRMKGRKEKRKGRKENMKKVRKKEADQDREGKANGGNRKHKPE